MASPLRKRRLNFETQNPLGRLHAGIGDAGEIE
jgi:hypothetical protein